MSITINGSKTDMLWYNSDSQYTGGRTGTELDLDSQAGMRRNAQASTNRNLACVVVMS